MRDAEPARTTAGTSTRASRSTRRPRKYECGNPEKGPDNTSRWNTGANVDPATEPGSTKVPPITQPDIYYSFRDNATPALGTPCIGSYDGSNGTCPQLFPELYSTGVAPHGAAPYRYDDSNPSASKFPPYYDGAFVLGEFNVDTLREVRVDKHDQIFKINRMLDCGAALSSTSKLPFECDNPMDMQFGADGNFYLLTYGDGFFQSNPDAGLYRWEYVKGQRAPQATMNASVTNGVTPLSVQFSSEGSRDPDPGDSIRFAWDFDGDGTVDSTDPNPTYVYTHQRRLHGEADRDGLGGEDGHQDAADRGRQHRADDRDQHAARR